MDGTIDWKHAHNAVGGSVELLLEVIDIFFEEHPKLIAGIQSSIESEDFAELRLLTHTLKGSLRYFGPTKAGDLSYELEARCKDQIEGVTEVFPIERAKEVFGQLRTELDAVISELKAFVASQSPDTGG